MPVLTLVDEAAVTAAATDAAKLAVVISAGAGKRWFELGDVSTNL